MGQISMEIYAPTGSLLSANLQSSEHTSAATLQVLGVNQEQTNSQHTRHMCSQNNDYGQSRHRLSIGYRYRGYRCIIMVANQTVLSLRTVRRNRLQRPLRCCFYKKG
jgi:hypothetical protein